MTHLLAVPALAGLRVMPATSGSPAIAPVDALYPDLAAFYEDLHRNPELSRHEERTSAKIAERLRGLGYEVTDRVGGFGVVARPWQRTLRANPSSGSSSATTRPTTIRRSRRGSSGRSSPRSAGTA